jgi:hypothetical protein
MREYFGEKVDLDRIEAPLVGDDRVAVRRSGAVSRDGGCREQQILTWKRVAQGESFLAGFVALSGGRRASVRADDGSEIAGLSWSGSAGRSAVLGYTAKCVFVIGIW